jgi:hypothetical protein
LSTSFSGVPSIRLNSDPLLEPLFELAIASWGELTRA